MGISFAFLSNDDVGIEGMHANHSGLLKKFLNFYYLIQFLFESIEGICLVNLMEILFALDAHLHISIRSNKYKRRRDMMTLAPFLGRFSMPEIVHIMIDDERKVAWR